MKNVIKITGLVAALAFAVVALNGCEDTDVVVPAGGVIDMTASPGTIRIDPNTVQPIEDLQSTITAFIFDSENLPLKGVTITFASNAETALSPTQAITDKNGRAETLLTATANDDAQIVVRSQSGGVSGDVTVAVDSVGQNQIPRAVIVPIPGMVGQVADVVTFDGSGSVDLDGIITCFQWEILSDNPDNPAAPNPEVVQGIAASGLQKTFMNEQTLAVTLRVSDKAIGPTFQCQKVDSTNMGTVEPAEAFSSDSAFLQYPILCNNPPPTAVISGPSIIQATGSASTLTSITLNGSLSSDNQTMLDRYVWNCGNEFAPTPLAPDNSIVICRYRLGSYTATLNVTDQGTGVINPGTGTYECQKTSAAASVIVNVVTP